MPTDSSSKLVPSQSALAWPVLHAIKRAGGAASNAEILDSVASDLKLTEEQMAVLCGHGSRTLLDYRLAWTRTLLRKVGAIANDAPSHWSITHAGTQMTHGDIELVLKEHFDNLTTRSRKQRASGEITK
jgi:restriction system protein